MLGETFGRLEVIGISDIVGYRKKWLCQCECGGTRAVYQHHLKSGMTRSCGCLHKEKGYVYPKREGPLTQKDRLIEIITFYHIYNKEQADRYGKLLKKNKKGWNWNKYRLSRMKIETLEALLNKLNEDPEYDTGTKIKPSKYD